MIINHFPSLLSDFQTNGVRWMKIKLSDPLSTNWAGPSLLCVSHGQSTSLMSPSSASCLSRPWPLSISYQDLGHLAGAPAQSPTSTPSVIIFLNTARSLHCLKLSIAWSSLAYHINISRFIMCFQISVPLHMLLPLALNIYLTPSRCVPNVSSSGGVHSLCFPYPLNHASIIFENANIVSHGLVIIHAAVIFNRLWTT